MMGRYPLVEYVLGRPGPPLSPRARTLFEEHRQAVFGLTDRLFALLMVTQFVLGLLMARGWVRLAGADHVLPVNALGLAIVLGGGFTAAAVALAWRRPGDPITRHVIAAAQLGFSALFIELTDGHVQTHFHIFGSLALLAFYRDWKVFVTATAVILGDQVVRPLLWPGSMLGLEHGRSWTEEELLTWMLLIEAFLISGGPRAMREMEEVARQRARLEETNHYIAEEVRLQTSAMAASEAQYRLLFQGHPLPMWVYDAETLAILNVNEAAVRGYGYTQAEFLARSITDLSPAGTVRNALAMLDGFNEPETSLTMHQRKDGTQLDVETIEHAFVLRDRPVRLLAAQDVTRRLRAERLIAVQQSVTRELAVAGTLDDAARPVLNLVQRSFKWDLGVLWLVDAVGEYIAPKEVVSSGPELDDLVQVIRRSRRERGEGLVGLTWVEGRPLGINDITNPALSAELAVLAERHGLRTLLSLPVIGGGRVVGVLQFVSRDNRMDDLPLVRALEAIARNIGQYIERKRLEERLHLLADIVEASSDAIYAVDLEARVISWNQGARQLYGYTAFEMIGHPVTRLAPPGRVGEQMEVIDRVAEGIRIENRELTRVRRDGTLVQVHLSAGPIRDTSGHVVGLSVVARDISEAKRLQARLHQAQRLESIGELAAGIAHEINTPTQYVGDNVQFLGRAFSELNECLAGWEALLAGPGAAGLDAGLRRQLDQVRGQSDLDFLRAEVPQAIASAQDGVSRISQIVGAMKEFSHPGTKEKVATDLNRAILSTITVARGEWKHHADVITQLDPELPAVACRADEFNQVILNLIVNAAHAIRDARAQRGPGKGTITVTTRAVPTGVEIRVADTGVGIPEEIRARVYDPFFTTKAVGKGTGQGLAIAHDVIVVKHGGTIDFESQTGVGTTFVVTLPLGTAEPALENAA